MKTIILALSSGAFAVALVTTGSDQLTWNLLGAFGLVCTLFCSSK